jgi:hypothetical protein
MGETTPQESIRFVVGEERDIAEILSAAEIAPLLGSLVRAGAVGAALVRDSGEVLWQSGSEAGTHAVTVRLPLQVEGEPVGGIEVHGPEERREVLTAMACLFRDTVQTILNTNLKRMMTTEIHTTVVNQSYDELLEANRQLAASEGRYKTLAENLEKIVTTRTKELQQAYVRLVQQEKMAAVGQLAAGMAHEINNPLGFVTSNLSTLAKYVQRFRDMLSFCRSSLAAPGLEGVREGVRREWGRLKIDPILADVDELFVQSLGGCQRVSKIVAVLKAFSHIDEGESGVVNLNEEIDRTLNVLAPQLPEDCVVRKNYGNLPGLRCNPAQLSQVMLNIIMNALQARPQGLHLIIETGVRGDSVAACFTDNGPGIPPAVQSRIFDPFFTTREVGAGLGLGLATAYDTITSWGGAIEVASEPGKGASFTLTLPIVRT